MARITSFVIGALLALSTIALAQGEAVTGVWKLSVGKADAPCTLSLASDSSNDRAGSASPSADCSTGLQTISRWREIPSGIELLSPAGGLVAQLKARNGGFTGSRVTDGKLLALDR